MNEAANFVSLLFLIGFTPLFAVFILYPVSLFMISQFKKNKHTFKNISQLPTVSLLIAVRNGETLVKDKIDNCFSMNYPKHLLDVIVISDGSNDQTKYLLDQYQHKNLKTYHHDSHIGKAASLNSIIKYTHASIFVFTDMDAILEPDAILLLVKKLQPAEVAGVCGQRALAKNTTHLKHSQKQYITFDSWIKLQESKLGFLTSNDGKLYAIKSQYFQPIANGVTDDLFTSLAVIKQNKQFLFEPNAIAYIKTPARNPLHEINRRRRITCRSLKGIFLHKALLNPFQFGAFSFALFCNKILRRMFPFGLILIFSSNLFLLSTHVFFTLSLISQCVIYTIVYSMYVEKYIPKGYLISKVAYALFYFILGNIGMMFGVFDFLSNKHVIKWEPNKND